MSFTLPTPQLYVFEAAPEIFDDIAIACGASKAGIELLGSLAFDWVRDNDRERFGNIVEAGRPIFQAMVDYFEIWPNEEWSVSVDCRPVKPGSVQRQPEWHPDGAPGICISNFLSTECVYGTLPDNHSIVTTLHNREKPTAGTVQVAIDDGYLTLVTFDDCVAGAITTEHLHRSKTNESAEIVEKVFVRGNPNLDFVSMRELSRRLQPQASSQIIQA